MTTLEERDTILRTFGDTVAKDSFFICVVNDNIGVKVNQTPVVTQKDSQVWWDSQRSGSGSRVWHVSKKRGPGNKILFVEAKLIRSK